jgi:hypothetical protein
MDDDFLACVYSKSSHRHAILADDGVTGILYLHAPSDDPTRTGKVEATCFAYNRVDPIDTKDVQSYRPNPPPIATGYASNHAVCRNPMSTEWKLSFSIDGTAVLLTRDGEPWAIVALSCPRGSSKAIQTPGPWGAPWSGELHDKTEWGGEAMICE